MSTERAFKGLLYIILAWLVAIAAGSEEELLGVLESNGGQFRITIGQSPHGAGRGLLATEFIPKGEVIARVPANQALYLGSGAETSPEMAITVLREKHRVARHHFDAYLHSLPGPTDMLIAEMLPQQLLPMLQSEQLELLVQQKTQWARGVWSGDEKVVFPLRRAVTRSNVTWEDFLWATAVANTRSIGLDSSRRFLIPVLDMANHHPDAQHLITMGMVGGVKSFLLVAAADIQPNEEVFINYGPLRNDEALLYYGFLLPATPPQLCAVDCRGYDPNQQPGKGEYPLISEPTEEVQKEHQRLTAILKQLDAAAPAAACEGADAGSAGSCSGVFNEMATLLWRFQQLRREAIEHELRRLEALMPAL